MSVYRAQVAAALEAVTIRGPTRYAWLGRRSKALPASIDAELDETGRLNYLVSCLRQELYWSFYCHGRPVPARWGAPGPITADPWLVDVLSEANMGTGGWEPGWTVLRKDGDEVIATSERLRARVATADCRSDAGAIRPGTRISVRLPKGLRELAPGFYTAVGNTAPPTAAGSVLRVYWNVASRGAPALVRSLTSRLNRDGVPFRLKVADHGLRFDRCDAAVLYVWCDAFSDVADALRDSAAELRTYMGPRTPAFTLELAAGVGLAEDGGDGESFGVRRCSQLAEGIARAHAREIVDVNERVGVVAERFAEDGVAIDAPYRDPSLADGHVL